MELPIVHRFPPNYEAIRLALPFACETHTYAYGGMVYSPDGHEVPPDILYHESIHIRQQGSDPDAWWSRYLLEPDFRLSQELEAYGEQYAKVRERVINLPGHTNLLALALDSMASALAGPEYGLSLSQPEAASKIRSYARSVV